MKQKRQARSSHSINREWWLLLSLFGVSAAVALDPFENRMVLFLYLAPVMVAAYIYGRRHAILTAIACVLLVISGTFFRVILLRPDMKVALAAEHWSDLAIWSTLLIGFATGLGWLFGDFRLTHEGFVD